MKKSLSIILTFIIVLSLFILPSSAIEYTGNATSKAVNEVITEISAPENVAYSVSVSNNFDMFFVSYFISEEIAKMMAEENKDIQVYLQTDWSIDKGDWHYESAWDKYYEQGFGAAITSIAEKKPIFTTYSPHVCERLGIEFSDTNHFDFKKHTLTMRSRYFVQITANIGLDNEETNVIVSNWSSTSNVTLTPKFDMDKVGKDLIIKDAKLVFDPELNEAPYFTFAVDWTKEQKDAVINILAHDNRILSLVCEKQKGNSEWEDCFDMPNETIEFTYGTYTINIPIAEAMSDVPIRYRLSLSYTPSTVSPLKEYKATSGDVLTYDYAEELKKAEEAEKEEVIEQEEKENNSKMIFVIIAIVVVAIAAIVISIVLIKKKRNNNDDYVNENEYENTSVNNSYDNQNGTLSDKLNDNADNDEDDVDEIDNVDDIDSADADNS